MANEPLMRIIQQLGGWPVLGQKSANSEQHFDWLELLIKFRKLGLSHDVLIDLSVTPDFRNNTKHIIDVSRSFANVNALCTLKKFPANEK